MAVDELVRISLDRKEPERLLEQQPSPSKLVDRVFASRPEEGSRSLCAHRLRNVEAARELTQSARCQGLVVRVILDAGGRVLEEHLRVNDVTVPRVETRNRADEEDTHVRVTGRERSTAGQDCQRPAGRGR